MEQQKTHKLKFYHIIFLIILCAGTVYVAMENDKAVNGGNSKVWLQKEMQRCQGSVFGTVYHITYNWGTDLHDSIKTVLAEVDNSLSPFNKQSNITAINNNQTPTPDARMLHVYQLAHTVSEQTHGAFDITVAPLVNLWGFGFENSDNVNEQAIDSLREFVGYSKVTYNDGLIHKTDPRIKLDCGAIAKGYGVDAIGEYLESQGVRNYMVEIGGEVRTRGVNPHGDNWRIGISKPVDAPLNTQTEIEQILRLDNVSVATSGNYRNFYIKDNKKYAHTIDPRTGYPVQHSILSSTVIAPDCATADAYATAFMVLGLEDAKKVLEQNTDLRAFFIYAVDSAKTAVWHSDNMNEMLINN